MENYPIIKIPSGLVNPKFGEEPKEPQKPIAPSQPKETGIFATLLVFFVAFLIMVFISTSTGESMVGFVLGIVVFFVIFIGFLRSGDKRKEQSVEQIKQFEKDALEYKKKYYIYQHILGEFKSQQRKLKSDPEFRKNFFYQKQLKYLESALKPEENIEVVTEGVSEQYFHNYLEDFFGSKIHTNLMLPNRLGGRPYYPDFVYWDKDKNLLIDIEIDEPYVGNGEKPIHYSSSDDERNKIFIRNRWIVIRFSEKQVIKYPSQCCQVIMSLIDNIFGEGQIKKLQTASLPKDNKWSYFEAQEMVNKNYRNTYLPNSLQLKVNKENVTIENSDEFNDDLPF